jgi:hypothetical protein
LSAKTKYDYHLSHWSDIQDHLPRLRAAARGNCLEIGVRSGCSTSALLAGIEEHGGHLYSVDINDCQVFRGHPDWTFYCADSIKDEAIKKLLANDYEVLFIDGDHTFEGAMSDLESFGPRAKRIFIHDVDAPDYPGVKLAVETFAKKTGRKVTYWPGSFGMAEIAGR